MNHLPTDTEKSGSITTKTMDFGVLAPAVFILLTTVYFPSTPGTVNAPIDLVVSQLAPLAGLHPLLAWQVRLKQ